MRWVLNCQKLFQDINIYNMKYLKLFESFEEIDSICKKYGITNYTVNGDGTVDVDGYVNFGFMKLKKLPIRFGIVTGDFSCNNNELTTLEGSPSRVGGYFICNSNELTTLKGGPSEVGGNFWCSNNSLTSLEGSPSEVGGMFWCGSNKLITLKGAPKEVGGDFQCQYNNLTNLEGSPSKVGGNFFCYNNEIITLEGAPIFFGGRFSCNDNPIDQVYTLFPDYESFRYSMDYGYIRGKNIVKSRFKEALDEVKKRVPKSIEGYKYI